jgi:hypothetical protein
MGNYNIAYICLCHQDPLFINRVAKALCYKDDGFFIHVDGKVDMEPFICACKELSNVQFVYDRIANFWGGYNSIIATMRTIQLALDCGRYDRFVLLQGQDYPLLSPTEMHDFFESHRNQEFCHAKEISLTDKKNEYMKICGFWLQDYRKDNILMRLTHLFFSGLNSLGIPYRKPYFKCPNGEKWFLYTGWAQWALTKECIDYIVMQYNTLPAFNNYIRFRFPPDELYFHTLIYNSPFKDRISDKIIYGRDGKSTMLNLTYFEYPVTVTVFTEAKEYDWLKNIGTLFVRKVNSSSTTLLDRIDEEILGDKNYE